MLSCRYRAQLTQRGLRIGEGMNREVPWESIWGRGVTGGSRGLVLEHAVCTVPSLRHSLMLFNKYSFSPSHFVSEGTKALRG